VRIIERAENVPSNLKDYVLAQIEREVLTGTGPTRDGGALSATHVSSAECRILRRAIFSSGGYGPAAVSRFDAEMLFRLKDATIDAVNAPEWGDLFVDGVSNFLRGFTLDNAQLDHSRKLELVKFVESPNRGAGGFLSAMAGGSREFGRNLRWAREHLTGTDGPQNDYTADAIAGDAVTDSEQNWVDMQINQDGKIDALEQRLIERLKEDG